MKLNITPARSPYQSSHTIFGGYVIFFQLQMSLSWLAFLFSSQVPEFSESRESNGRFVQADCSRAGHLTWPDPRDVFIFLG